MLNSRQLSVSLARAATALSTTRAVIVARPATSVVVVLLLVCCHGTQAQEADTTQPPPASAAVSSTADGASPRPAVNTVKDQGTLALTDVRFDNFRGTLASTLEVKAGEEAGLKFRVAGFSKSEGSDETGRPEYRVNLNYEITIRDPQGALLIPPATGQVETKLGPQDDTWLPSVEWSVRVPDSAPSGRYPVLIRLVDEIGKQSIEHTAALMVRGQTLKISGAFEIAQIEFAPAEGGPWRPVWYYELRAPVYVRYRIAGYTVSPEKQIRVEQDWAVMDASGKELLRQPAAAQENSQDYYPPRFLQNYFSLTLSDPQPGEYKLRVEARDLVGDQTATVDARFVLRP